MKFYVYVFLYFWMFHKEYMPFIITMMHIQSDTPKNQKPKHFWSIFSDISKSNYCYLLLYIYKCYTYLFIVHFNKCLGRGQSTHLWATENGECFSNARYSSTQIKWLKRNKIANLMPHTHTYRKDRLNNEPWKIHFERLWSAIPHEIYLVHIKVFF